MYKYSEKFTTENTEKKPLEGWYYNEDDNTFSLLKNPDKQTLSFIKRRTNMSYEDMVKYNNKRKETANVLLVVDGILTFILVITIIIFLRKKEFGNILSLIFIILTINSLLLPSYFRLNNKLNQGGMQMVTSIGYIIFSGMFDIFYEK